MVLKTAPHAFEDLQTVQANGGGTNWPWRNAGAARTLLEGFEPLSIPFDLASLGVPAGSSKGMEGLPLRPGFEYRFEAFLRITPQVARTPPFGQGRVYGWRSSVVRKKASARRLEGDEPSNVARVRYSISLDSTTMASMQTVICPLGSGFRV